MKEELEHILSNQFGTSFQIYSMTPIHGGDINDSFKLTTSENEFFIKLNKNQPKDFFDVESFGLNKLREHSSFRIPKVIETGVIGNKAFLLMEYMGKGAKTSSYWKSFGEKLAELHKNSSESFGLEQDNYIGLLQQSNKAHKTWPSFYFEERILPQLELLNDSKGIEINKGQLEKLRGSLHELFEIEPPSLIHGDLWSGNIMADEKNQPALIDPSVYYGHREMDIAMTQLFGGFDSLFLTCYNNVYPLQKNWQNRIRVCQLYPLLVHANLFGGHYTKSVLNIIRDFS